MASKWSLFLVALLVMSACASAPGSAPTVAIERRSTSAGTGASDLPRIYSNKHAMRHVKALARKIGPRVRAKPNELKASKYIRQKFESYGYQTKVQKFSVDGGTSRNVIAWWPDSRKLGLVVGAHMDTVRHSPGANDNASGVAVMLEMARDSAGRSPSRFVRFVAFGAEEYGTNGQHHNGSQVYVNRLGPEGRKRLGGMVSIDMVAKGRPLIAATTGMAPRVVARTVYNQMKKKVGMSMRTTCDCSDNGPFERAGIPSVFLWSGFEPNHHEPTDTVRNLKPKDLKRTGQGFRLFIKQVDLDMIRRFRRAR
jgi:Zn-dependent M28 family amino/carboxypeptidase